jgi:hypothetical protein
MQAFPKDSANNVIGGSGPVNKNINLAQFHGHTEDGFTDFSAAGSKGPQPQFEPYAGSSAPYRGDARPGIDRTSSFNPTAKADLIHGDVTIGLGTTTFLEGAPAPRVAIQRRESEGEFASGGGLGRKKSLAQKIRGMSNATRPSRAIVSPEPRYETTTSPLQSPAATPAANSRPGIRETNPFFKDYDDAYDQKGASIKAAEELKRTTTEDGDYGRSRGLSSPQRPTTAVNVLERQITTDSDTPQPQTEGDGKSGGGFLSRVKSLRGGKRDKPRAERRETSG